MSDKQAQVDWRAHHGEAFAGRRVAVTGAAGFIGSHIAAALGELGAAVVAFDDLSNGDWSNLDHAAGDVRRVTGSVCDLAALSAALEGCEFVFHHAARVSVAESVTEPSVYCETNVGGTLNVLEASRSAGVRRVMYAGSASAYGDPRGVDAVDESVPPMTMNPYAATKLAGELLLESWAHCHDMDAVTLRYFNIFGPRQRADSPYSGVIAAFAHRLLAGEPVTIHGDGGQTRDFVYVANAAHANLLAARCEQPLMGRRFNIGTGRSVSVNGLFAQVAQMTGRDTQAAHGEARVGDIRHSKANAQAAHATLGFEPVVGFEAGLAQTVAWYQQQAQGQVSGARG